MVDSYIQGNTDNILFNIKLIGSIVFFSNIKYIVVLFVMYTIQIVLFRNGFTKSNRSID